ncbi:methyltransferase [Pseudonocardia nigra]|uniref:methyltransferase n=1 Tax=Pseudonocardia nigra TaxID=1921578 RepID=UPI001C602DE6|nr:methyltransferase [Pseudonocardia nigra]
MTDRRPPEILLELSSAHILARALHVVAEIGTADDLGAEARSAEELAGGSGVTPDALGRLLRLLETQGVFSADEAGRWRHTESSRWLRSDHPTSVRAFVRMMGMPFGWGSFTALDHALRTDEPSVRVLDPAGPWAYLAAHPDQNAIFQQAMLAKAHGDVAAVLAAYDFSRHRRIADVAGGGGHLINAVLAAHEGTSGVLFELPHVAATVPASPRLEVVAGDFFADPLPACDAYLLMNIVHDWDDAAAGAILAAVAAAGRPGATVLLVETLLPEGPEPHWAKTLDVMMLALTGGRERTLTAYRDLLDAADLECERAIPTATAFSIVQARVRQTGA